MKDWKESFLKDIQEISNKKNLRDYDAFVFWYIKTTEDLSDEEIIECLTNKSHDFGVDAFIIDKTHEVIKIIQSKYSVSIGESGFDKDELTKLNKVYDYLARGIESPEIKDYLHKGLKGKFEEAIRLIKEEQYSVKLIFITTHKFNNNYKVYENAGAEINIIHSEEIARKYNDWLVGHVPELGELSLKYVSHVHGPPTEPKAYLMVLNTEELRKQYEKYKERLFSRNVRIFYNDKPKPNKNMKKTLREKPENFWYFNNGITILADSVNIEDTENKVILKNPQIINGCQTVSTVGTANKNNPVDSFLFAKIIEVSDNIINQELIDGVIEANNRQTPVDERMLKSNHPLQVRLQRELSEEGFYYERKEGQYQEECKSNIVARLKPIKNIDLVRANIAIIEEPHLSHAKEDDLFSTHFNVIFKDNKSYLDYLIPYLIWKKIIRIARDYHGEKKKRFQTLASFHILKLIYANCDNLNNNLKRKSIYQKLWNKEPYEDFEFNERVIKKLFDIAFDKFNRSEFKEKDSGQRDFFKNKNSYKLIEATVPQYIKKEVSKIFD